MCRHHEKHMMMKHRMMMNCGMDPHHGPGMGHGQGMELGPCMGHGHGPSMRHGPAMEHGPPMGRHFISKDEKIEKLEEYRTWLEKEAKGVEEFIAKMKKE